MVVRLAWLVEFFVLLDRWTKYFTLMWPVWQSQVAFLGKKASAGRFLQNDMTSRCRRRAVRKEFWEGKEVAYEVASTALLEML